MEHDMQAEHPQVQYLIKLLKLAGLKNDFHEFAFSDLSKGIVVHIYPKEDIVRFWEDIRQSAFQDIPLLETTPQSILQKCEIEVPEYELEISEIMDQAIKNEKTLKALSCVAYELLHRHSTFWEEEIDISYELKEQVRYALGIGKEF